MVYVNAEDAIYTIKKEDIFKFSSELTPSNFKALFWAGGGIGYLADGYYNSRSINTRGFSLQLSGMIPLSESRGIRVNISYSKWNGIPYHDQYTSYSEQNIHHFYLRADYIFGTFSPANKFKIYGYPGLGINFRKESEYSYTYYSSYDSTYYTSYEPERNYTSVLFSLGGGMGYLFSKNLGIYTEAEYNSGEYFIFGRGGYFLIKAGVVYTIF